MLASLLFAAVLALLIVPCVALALDRYFDPTTLKSKRPHYLRAVRSTPEVIHDEAIALYRKRWIAWTFSPTYRRFAKADAQHLEALSSRKERRAS